jgi:hypothetical protein
MSAFLRNNTNRYGLLVGINSYPNFGSNCNLDGCLSDVSAMSQLLRDNFGFSDQGLILLQDDQATRQGILDAFDSLTRRAEKDDIIVIQFSGHGSEMRAAEGIKPNGYYQTIVPHDSGRNDKKNLDIIDDLIYLKMLDLTEITPYVTFIFDSCHSGTIVRDVFANKARYVEPDTRSIATAAQSPPLTDDQMARLKATWGPSARPLSQRYVLLASCRDEEVSFEHVAGSTPHGAFTYFLCQELGRAEPGASFRDIFERTRDAVSSHYPTQHPQLEGVWDRALFSTETYTPKKYLLVKERREGLITLNGGAAQGLTIGSVYGVYPPGTRTDEKAEQKIGSVALRQVRAVTADAAVGPELTEAAIAGCRAFEEKHFYGEMRTVLSVEAPAQFETARQEILRLISASNLLRLASNGEKPAVQIYLIPPRKEAPPESPVPQIRAIDQPSWVAVDQSGQPVVATCQLHEAFRLIANLETRARHSNTSQLKNVNPNNILAGKVTFTLRRFSDEAGWKDAVPDAHCQKPVFTVGDRIALEIKNNHTGPIYFYVLDLGLSGAISQLYPPLGANEQLAPGNRVCLGDKRGQEIELFLPDSFPFVRNDGLEAALQGDETFKLFVTTREADFSTLLQPGFRGSRGYRSTLDQLMNLGLTGQGQRDARPLRVPQEEEWTTEEKSFTLRAR